MNRHTIPALVALLLALAIAIGSQTFMGACVHDDGSFGACHWASRALLGVGGLLAALALSAMCVPSARLGLYIAMALTCILGILTPGTLIALCQMATMRCRALMQPATTILFALSLAASAVGAWLSRREAR